MCLVITFMALDLIHALNRSGWCRLCCLAVLNPLVVSQLFLRTLKLQWSKRTLFSPLLQWKVGEGLRKADSRDIELMSRLATTTGKF